MTMTREEAIKIFRIRKEYATLIKEDVLQEAINLAIEALIEPINCVKCKHYYETEDDTDVHGHCKMDTAHTDLINRVDALKPFCIAPDGTRIPEVDCDNFPVEFNVEFIKKHLLSLPSFEADWIPCSERLPEVGEICLLTVHEYGWNCKDYTRVIIGEYNDNYANHILAWMPLPKPYKEDGEA